MKKNKIMETYEIRIKARDKNSQNEIQKWCDDTINGSGGFIDFENREYPIWNVSREQAIVEWVIRCLGNIDNEGSEMILNKIIEHRKKTSIK